jgi:hypothetical protein
VITQSGRNMQDQKSGESSPHNLAHTPVVLNTQVQGCRQDRNKWRIENNRL